MPLPQSRDRIRNDVRLQRRLIRDLTNYVNSSGISISSDSQSDDDTVNLPISNISYQHQEPEHPHYRTETISSRARKGECGPFPMIIRIGAMFLVGS